MSGEIRNLKREIVLRWIWSREMSRYPKSFEEVEKGLWFKYDDVFIEAKWLEFIKDYNFIRRYSTNKEMKRHLHDRGIPMYLIKKYIKIKDRAFKRAVKKLESVKSGDNSRHSLPKSVRYV